MGTKRTGNFSTLSSGSMCILAQSPIISKYLSEYYGSVGLLIEEGRGIWRLLKVGV